MTKDSRFNVQDALRRLMNNKKLYQKALECFQNDYQHFDVQLTQLLQEGRHEDAHFQLHTMKGLSGSLGADHLHELCKKMEPMCKTAAPFDDFQPYLEEFSAELKQVIQEIQDGVDMG